MCYLSIYLMLLMARYVAGGWFNLARQPIHALGATKADEAPMVAVHNISRPEEQQPQRRRHSYCDAKQIEERVGVPRSPSPHSSVIVYIRSYSYPVHSSAIQY